MLLTKLFVPLSLVLGVVTAGGDNKLKCTTQYGGYSQRYVPHSTLTHTSTCYNTMTKRIGSTTKSVTPKPTTKYVTKTSTIKKTVTSTGAPRTTTTTQTSLSVVRTTTTKTVSGVVTVTPTFRDSQDTLGRSAKKRSAEDISEPLEDLLKRSPRYVQKYPTAVTCTTNVEKHLTKTITQSLPTHTITLKQKTVYSTHSKSKTITSASTKVIHKTSTVTKATSKTTTSVITQTTITGESTTTSWSTVAGPTPTVCMGTNIYDFSDKGFSIQGVDTKGNTGVVTTDQTAEDCCLSCVTVQGCAGSYFNRGEADGRKCTLLMTDQCDSANGQWSSGMSIRDLGGVSRPGITVSNGYCGVWQGVAQR